MEVDVIILSGGLGSRLLSYTKDTPKILVKINGKTVLDRLLAKLEGVPVRRVILAVSHLSEKIVDYVDGSKYEFPIYFSHSESLLGTGGALKKALNDFHPVSSNFLVMSGDILCDVNLSDMFNLRHSYDGILLGVYVRDMAEYGSLIVNREMEILDFQEKANHSTPGLVDGGIYLFNDSIVSYFPVTEKFSLEYDVFPKENKLYAFPYYGNWMDVGTPQRLEQAEFDFI